MKQIGIGAPSRVAVSADCGVLQITLSGDWLVADGFQSIDPVAESLAAGLHRVAVDARAIGKWDSSLLVWLERLHVLCVRHSLEMDCSAAPEGARRLLALAHAVPPRSDATANKSEGFRPFSWTGDEVFALFRNMKRDLAFFGEVTVAFGHMLRGRATFQGADFLLAIQQCGAQALPIVTVISFLIGLIIAFVGAVQLRLFGADLYVANLVTVAMVREMGALMTGIVLAGRTGAAFAAQISAMQGNEEIDSLTTLGVSPIEFLVLPRLLAMLLMTPLLTIYANFLGMAGGLTVSALMLDIAPAAYINQSQISIQFGDFFIGVTKSLIFGLIVAVSGCLKGIQSGRSAASVGEATTAAVVAGILYIIIADGIFAVMMNRLGI